MTAWIVFAAIGVGTYTLRVSMFVLLGDRTLPRWTATPLALVAPAAITALVASMLLTRGSSIHVVSANELIAVVAAFVVTRRTGNVMLAIVIGMPIYWLASLTLS